MNWGRSKIEKCYVPNSNLPRPFLEEMKMRRDLELYIHIPFCVKKCAYCDFLSGPADEETMEYYVRALIREIESIESMKEMYRVVTVFVGGGTPSVLGGEQIERIFAALREKFAMESVREVTIEANPGTVTREKLKAYRSAGINRISFGLQSANNGELKQLGRIHTYEEFLESYMLAREEGFDNINIDLISAIPNQTVESWKSTVDRILKLQPEHISAYSLIVEEGTPFEKMYGEDGNRKEELPSEEEERLIYQKTKKWLQEAGYERYEISNYAKKGYACRHNLGYWERKEYLGLGLGASSLIGNVRFQNTEEMKTYLKYSDDVRKRKQNEEVLTKEEELEEIIFLGLRKKDGISKKEVDFFCGEQIEKMICQGFLEEKDGNIRLTERGIDISNYVFAEILALSLIHISEPTRPY